MAAPMRTAPTVHPPLALTTKPELPADEVVAGAEVLEAEVAALEPEADPIMEDDAPEAAEEAADEAEAWLLVLTAATTVAVLTALVEETATVLAPFSTTK